MTSAPQSPAPAAFTCAPCRSTSLSATDDCLGASESPPDLQRAEVIQMGTVAVRA